MKRTLERYVEFNGKLTLFKFEYWPFFPSTRTQPEEKEEIHILFMKDANRNEIPIPCADTQPAEYNEIVEFLLNFLAQESQEEAEAMATIAIEPWD